MAPIRLRDIKTYTNKGRKLSVEVKNLMEERNMLRRRAKSTNNPEDWSEWKILKNRVNRLVRKEKARQKENMISEVSKDTTAKKLWNYIKSKACWTTSMALTILKAS